MQLLRIPYSSVLLRSTAHPLQATQQWQQQP
jgi:hypothetical protein